ncbi:MAG: 2-dehydropantoate 2-reductase N-terminal domain-containing protein [Acidimicrobiales bacterium]
MRFVVYGAGAVGGVLGARLFQADQNVVLIARGAHHDAIRANGLRLICHDEDVTLSVPVVGHPSELTFTKHDVVVLAMKTQHTAPALDDLAAAASSVPISIVCAQNGVENERLALRWFADIYAVCVMCPSGHLEPGVVEAFASPISGLLDLGRYPTGLDDRGRAIATAIDTTTFQSIPRDDIMRWKYNKLIMNLTNAANALCGSSPAIAEISGRARAEAEQVLRAAHIDFVSQTEDTERRGDLLQMKPYGPGTNRGSSTWQSLRRGAGSVETDYLNGEIAMLGRQVGVPTPVNEVLQRLCSEYARLGRPAGSLDPADLAAQLG